MFGSFLDVQLKSALVTQRCNTRSQKLESSKNFLVVFASLSFLANELIIGETAHEAKSDTVWNFGMIVVTTKLSSEQ